MAKQANGFRKTEAIRTVDSWDEQRLMAEYQLVMDKSSPHPRSIRDIIQLKVFLMTQNKAIREAKIGKAVSTDAEK